MKLSKNKKATWTMQEISKIILALVVFFILLGFIYSFMTHSTKWANEQVCREAIVLSTGLAKKLPSGEYLPRPWPKQCQTQEKEIEGETKGDVERQVAELMRMCWWMMGEGQLNVFSKLTLSWNCYMCYIIKPTELQEPIDEDDFNNDLRLMLLPSGTSYWNYLRSTMSEKEMSGWFDYIKPVLSDIEKDNYYAIIYLDHSLLRGDQETIHFDAVYLKKLENADECMGGPGFQAEPETGTGGYGD